MSSKETDAQKPIAAQTIKSQSARCALAPSFKRIDWAVDVMQDDVENITFLSTKR